MFHILQVQLRIFGVATVLEGFVCNVDDVIDRYAIVSLALNYLLPMDNLEIVLDINKE